jgi:O-antigen ligase
MLGTFYSSNQYGAFAAGIAVFGAALVLSRDSLLRWLGAVTAVTGGVGCALSHSAASTALLLAGAAFLMVASLVAGGRRFVRVAALSSIAALVYGAAAGLRALVAGPPVGATASWMPTSYGTAKLSQSKFDDLRARFHYWNVAWHDFLASPWTGHGHGWFGYHFGQTMHPGEFFSRWAHSGILQALADGGLLFGLPVALASAALLALAARRLLRSRRLIDTDPIMLAAAVAAVVFVVHAQFDFDWNYPVLAGVLGLVGGFMISPHRPGSSARS